MEDSNISDRLKQRFHLFSQFFKGFLHSGQSDRSTEPNVRADQGVYDDTGNYGNKRILEFPNNAPRSHPHHGQWSSEPLESRNSSTRTDPFDFFSNTKSFFEEFERTMKIFDDFAFNTAAIPKIGPGRDSGPTIEEIDDDQDQRYFKFFGRGHPNATTIIEQPNAADNPETGPSPDKNLRDLMLKPDQKDQGRFAEHDLVPGHSHSFLGRILDSIWDTNGTDRDSESVFGNLFPNGDFQGGSYFSFSSQESTLQSDGSNVSITATKIRETPEGREIITYKTNKNGVTEETREFIKREDLPNSNSPGRSPVIGGFFRPRL